MYNCKALTNKTKYRTTNETVGIARWLSPASSSRNSAVNSSAKLSEGRCARSI